MSEVFCTGDDVNAEWSQMIRSGLGLPGVICRYEKFGLEEDGILDAHDYRAITTFLVDILKVRQAICELRIRFQSHEKYHSTGHSAKILEDPRSLHASRLAINIFSVVTEYMLEAVLSTDLGCKAAQMDLFDMVSASGHEIIGRLNALSFAAKSEYRALESADSLAATQTGLMSRMMIRKVLDSPISQTSKLQYCQPIVDRLYDLLGKDTTVGR